MIGIINYGLGNISAFKNIYRRLNIESNCISSPVEIEKCTKLILPGVGSFDHALDSLNKSELLPSIENAVINSKKPILGVCVGMQILANKSMEGEQKGLGWIPGEVLSFSEFNKDGNLRIPQIGWNNLININRENPLFKDISINPKFYFLHSFFYKCQDYENSISETTYGEVFTSSICKDNIFGVQFHPEKSHINGIKVLKNFALL
tara:strand:- start:11564 stop:12181 length:618 start_codon:yes stop_codon:yes gene_type:complete